MSSQILNSVTCQIVFELLLYTQLLCHYVHQWLWCVSTIILKIMPILGVKEAMSAMSNPSLLSTVWLEKPSLTHE